MICTRICIRVDEPLIRVRFWNKEHDILQRIFLPLADSCPPKALKALFDPPDFIECVTKESSMTHLMTNDTCQQCLRHVWHMRRVTTTKPNNQLVESSPNTHVDGPLVSSDSSLLPPLSLLRPLPACTNAQTLANSLNDISLLMIRWGRATSIFHEERLYVVIDQTYFFLFRPHSAKEAYY
jgi:hypothetical protein